MGSIAYIFLQSGYPVFLGAWRRWFGSDGWKYKIFNIRFLKHVVGFLACFGYVWSFHSWWQGIIVGTILQGFFWAVGHGPAFDLARDKNPSEETIKRYKNYFWNKWCERLVPKDGWYGYFYDFLWLFFRYELPAILIAITLFNWRFLAAGFFASFIYAVCWALHDNKKIKGLGATELAEILVGISTGILL